MLGVAGLVAILAHISSADPVAAFRDGLVLIIAFFAAAGAVAAALLTGRPARPARPAVPSRAVRQLPAGDARTLAG